MEQFKIFEHFRVEHFEENHMIDFKMRKEPKVNMSDFGAFQDFRAYASMCKIHLLHAFWGISRKTPYFWNLKSRIALIIDHI